MALESFFKQENTNIKNFAIEEPEKKDELPFSPEDEKSDEDWGAMKKQLDDYKSANKWEEYLIMTSAMKSIFPEMSGELELDLENNWLKIKELIKKTTTEAKQSNPKNQRIIDFNVDMIFAKIGFPEKIEELNLKADIELWTVLKNKFNEFRDSDKLDDIGVMGLGAKLVFPDRFHELNIDDDYWKKALVKLDEYRGSVKSWDAFTTIGMLFKFNSPNLAKELKINNSEWRDIVKEIREEKRNAYVNQDDAWANFAVQILSAKILSAEKAELTDKGLEITMPRLKPELGIKKTEMPETRKY